MYIDKKLRKYKKILYFFIIYDKISLAKIYFKESEKIGRSKI